MQPINCLLIDDDEDDRDFFAIVLDGCGQPYNLIAASSGANGLGLLKSADSVPDYIFLDLNMPLLSGKECLERIRKMVHLQQVPVIIYSTSSYFKDIEDTRQLGATFFLTKSADIDTLSRILCDIFNGEQLPFVLS